MKVDSYNFGNIVIDGRAYTSDVIIYPTRVFSPWWRKEGHMLCIDDLGDLFEEKPDLLIVGCGYHGVMKVPDEVIGHLEDKGIETSVRKTTEAVEIFNQHREGRVVAALHLTC